MGIVDIPQPEKTIAIGISACLMGQAVRYNGGHKRSSFCVDTLAPLFHLISVCPEVAVGMGVPREPIRLVGDGQNYRVKGSVRPELDMTDALFDYGVAQARELTSISGYILMQKSPSCGMERVKVYRPDGRSLEAVGRGLYARALMETRPQLPVEEEGRLNDPVLRENFFARVYAYHRWHAEVIPASSLAAITAFHSAHKYMLMAHNPQDYAELGRLLANGKALAIDELMARYFSGFMATLSRLASRKSHTNVLLHLLGYIKQTVASQDRQKILRLVEEYRQGLVPLVAPVSLLRHFLDSHGSDYVRQQAYLRPYPEQLGLRNQI